LYIFEVVSPGCDFVLSVLVKRLAGKEHLWNDLFCVEWDQSIDQCYSHSYWKLHHSYLAASFKCRLSVDIFSFVSW